MSEYKSFDIRPNGMKGELVVVFQKTLKGGKNLDEITFDESSLQTRIKNLEASKVNCDIEKKALVKLQQRKGTIK